MRAMEANDRLLVLGMYPVDTLNKAAAVRIRSLIDALELRHPGRVDSITGTMPQRRRAIRAFWREGRDKQVGRVYVESHSTTGSESDLLALRRLKRAGKRIIIYVRDAYPLYDSLDIYPGLKGLVYKLAFRLSFNTYLRTADRLAFPSAGLAAGMGIRHADALLLPPGMHTVAVPPAVEGGAFLLVGGSAGAANGLDLYVAAARARPGFSFIWCAQPRYTKEIASWDLPDNFRIEHWHRDDIIANLERVKAFVIPRQVSPYMDLCVPIKLMDYLSWGRPIVATRCEETARLLKETGSGIPVDDTVEGILAGIDIVGKMDAQALEPYRERSVKACERYSWGALADKILQAFEQIEA